MACGEAFRNQRTCHPDPARKSPGQIGLRRSTPRSRPANWMLMTAALLRNTLFSIPFWLALIVWSPAVVGVHAEPQADPADLPDMDAHPGLLFTSSLSDHPYWGLSSIHLTISSDVNPGGLPSWLHLNESSRTLQGIPTPKDVGSTQIVITSPCKAEISSNTSSCPTTSTVFLINVRPFKWSGQAVPGDESLQEHSECYSESVLASLILCVSLEDLPWERKRSLVETMADFVAVSPFSVHLELSSSSRLRAIEMGFQIMSAGPGSDTECSLESNLELLWALPCPVVRHLSDFAKVMQHNVDVGRFQEELGAAVVGWYVASSNSLLTRKHRRRRDVSLLKTIMPTPTPAIPLPTKFQPSSDESLISPTAIAGQLSSASSSSGTLDFAITSSGSLLLGSSISRTMPSIDDSSASVWHQDLSSSITASTPSLSPTQTFLYEGPSSVSEIQSAIASKDFCPSCIPSSEISPIFRLVSSPIMASSDGISPTSVYSAMPSLSTSSETLEDNISTPSFSLPLQHSSASILSTHGETTTYFEVESVFMHSPMKSGDFTSTLSSDQKMELSPSVSSSPITSMFDIETHLTATVSVVETTMSEYHLISPSLPMWSSTLDLDLISPESVSLHSHSRTAELTPSLQIDVEGAAKNESPYSSQPHTLSLEVVPTVETSYAIILSADIGSSSPAGSASMKFSSDATQSLSQPESTVVSSTRSGTTPFSKSVSITQSELESLSSATRVIPASSASTTTESPSSAPTTTEEPDTTFTTITTEVSSLETFPPFGDTTPIQVSPNSWPIVENPINLIIGEQGRLLEFTIPHDVFFDIEDGNTRHLTLTLEMPHRRQLPPSFWLYLETRRADPLRPEPPIQMLKGLPLHQDMDIKNVSVSLVATDSGGLYRDDPIVLQINESPRTRFTHRFTLRFDYDFQAFMRDRRNIFELMDRIASHFNDSSPRFITVLEVRHGSFILSWTNNTLSGSVCQKQAIKHLLNRMMKRDGTVRSSFIRRLGRHLHPVEISYKPLGPCIPPPTTASPTTTIVTSDKEGHGLSIWAHVILPVLIALVVFILILFIIFICNRRRKQRQNILNIEKDAFSNERNPIIFPDEVESDDPVLRPKHPIVLPSDPHPPYYQQQQQHQCQSPKQPVSGRSHQPHRHRDHQIKNDRKANKTHERGHRKHRDRDQTDPNHTSDVAESSGRPENRYPNEGDNSRTSSPISNQSGSPTKRPPPYWQSQSHPPPYRLPPPYLTDQDSADVGNGEGAQLNLHSSQDTFTTTQV